MNEEKPIDAPATAKVDVGDPNAKDGCFDCGRPYGNEYGFPDLVISNWAWKKIAPKNGEGLLCPSCICERLHAAEITCEGAFMSGPVTSIPSQLMSALCGIDNINEWLESKE